MIRVPEPELMDSDEQARAYAAADFSEAHQSYVTLFHETFPDRPARARVLDLGCGAADVVIRFAQANPRYTFHAVDGSAAMLKYARKALQGHPNLAASRNSPPPGRPSGPGGDFLTPAPGARG